MDWLQSERRAALELLLSAYPGDDEWVERVAYMASEQHLEDRTAILRLRSGVLSGFSHASADVLDVPASQGEENYFATGLYSNSIGSKFP